LIKDSEGRTPLDVCTSQNLKDLFVRYNSELKEQEGESVTLHYNAEDLKIDVIEEEDD
jgi:hypothetical protein